MTAPDTAPAPETGWHVLDPDGNVVDSGPPTVLEAAADTGDAPIEEE